MINPPPIDAPIQALIDLAVAEDLGHAGDRTVQLAIPSAARAAATIVPRRPGVVCGAFLLPAILNRYAAADSVICDILAPDGASVSAGDPIAHLAGPARQILSAERVLLNFLGRLSGVATLTRQYVDAVSHHSHPPAICDTRKTTPGFRALEKFAVRCGGGLNHRMGLYDGVMLKDNHLAALREKLGRGLTLADLTAHIRKELPAEITLWLEVDSIEQLIEALGPAAIPAAPAADIILLDNFSTDQLRQAVEIRNEWSASQAQIENQKPDTPRPLLESSGGVTLELIAAVAATGVERVGIGAVTHSAPALDIAMDFA